MYRRSSGNKLIIGHAVPKNKTALGTWRNLDVAIKTIVFLEVAADMDPAAAAAATAAAAAAAGAEAGALTDKQRALMEAAVCR